MCVSMIHDKLVIPSLLVLDASKLSLCGIVESAKDHQVRTAASSTMSEDIKAALRRELMDQRESMLRFDWLKFLSNHARVINAILGVDVDGGAVHDLSQSCIFSRIFV
jgi:hypothetical protein